MLYLSSRPFYSIFLPPSNLSNDKPDFYLLAPPFVWISALLLRICRASHTEYFRRRFFSIFPSPAQPSPHFPHQRDFHRVLCPSLRVEVEASFDVVWWWGKRQFSLSLFWLMADTALLLLHTTPAAPTSLKIPTLMGSINLGMACVSL